MSDETTCDGCGETSEERNAHICNGDRDRGYRLRMDRPYEAGQASAPVACLAKVLSALGARWVEGPPSPEASGLGRAPSARAARRDLAKIEVLGHRGHVGRVREETLAGVSFLRVDALRANGTFEAVL